VQEKPFTVIKMPKKLHAASARPGLHWGACCVVLDSLAGGRELSAPPQEPYFVLGHALR